MKPRVRIFPLSLFRRKRRKGSEDGFLMVEILMDGLAASALWAIVGLMGAQSAIAFPRWSESRTQAQVSVMRLELENLQAAQALHFLDRGTYASSLGSLGFEPSAGMELTLSASATGWSATVFHEELGRDTGCSVYVGSALPPRIPVTPSARARVECTGEAPMVTPEAVSS
ncbi:MAG: hypothetical protein R3304_11170 [Longimicrobiales bacterium]|nr:hypothetical protein [Longimicrobiales bacterium]